MGRILTLPPERGCVEDQPQQPRKTCWQGWFVYVGYFHPLRLVGGPTQPRSVIRHSHLRFQKIADFSIIFEHGFFPNIH